MSEPAPAVRLRFAGQPHLQARPGDPWHRLSPLSAALLFLLAVEGKVARERASELLWPASADHEPWNLSDRLRVLRAQTGGAELVTGRGVLELAPDVEHDLAQLERLRPGDIAPGAFPPAELLAGATFSRRPKFDAWVSRQRDQWRRRRHAVIVGAVEHWIERSRFESAVAIARSLVGENPADEAACRGLMQALYRAGDRDGALAAFEALARVTSPSVATRRLHTLMEAERPLPGDPVEAAGATPPGIRLVEPGRMVGRESEVADIEAALRDGQSVWLEGESGVGKTRLLEAVARRLSEPCEVTCLHGEEAKVFSSLGRILHALRERCADLHADSKAELARIASGFGRPPGSPTRWPRLVAAIRDALAEAVRRKPLVLILDDVQFGDPSSMALLAEAMSAAPGVAAPEAVTLLVASPSAEAAAAQLRALASERSWRRIALAPLDAPSIEAYLRALPIRVRDTALWGVALHARTLGNPKALAEVIAALHALPGARPFEEPPPAADDWPIASVLSELVRERLQRLPREQLQLAQIAALAGPLFSPALAEALIGRSPIAQDADWHALTDATILRGQGLAHEALREPLRQSISAPIERAIRLQLLVLGPKHGAEPGELARHAEAAGEWAQAAALYESAAAAAFALNARAQQVRELDLAAAAHLALGLTEDAFRCLLAAFDAAIEVEGVAEWQARLERLAGLAHRWGQKGGVDASVEVAFAHARAAVHRYDFNAALHHLGIALPAAHAAAEQAGSASRQRWLRMACIEASALAGLGRVDDAAHSLSALGTKLRPDDSPRVHLDVATARVMVLGLNARPQEMIETISKVIALATELDDLAELTVGQANLAFALTSMGDYRGAREVILETYPRLADAGGANGHVMAKLLQNHGHTALRLGRFREAIERLQRAFSLAQATGDPFIRSAAESVLASAFVLLGAARQARETLSAAGSAVGGTAVLRAMACAALAELEGGSALAELEAAAPHLSQSQRTLRLGWTLARSRFLPVAEALSSCEAAATEALAAGLTGAVHAAWFHAAEALWRAGEPRQALATLTPVTAGLDTCQPPYVYQGEIWLLSSRCHGLAGDAGAAITAAQAGIDWVDRVSRDWVPDDFRDGFLKNPTNAALRGASETR
jgi:DNA-binding SARP family transcriptional activator/tetratricopeptide (TPR) repeat protein